MCVSCVYVGREDGAPASVGTPCPSRLKYSVEMSIY